ncbi:hypothetical protein M513_08741 [Trichuris suis]|uniref:Uncharacterized protein n=1 Tax=Trichuris suis TaxID=68888 RepID=A0A085LZG3_9BILA|nr:hypothetical protein M513_08741 [Trichuris suis]
MCWNEGATCVLALREKLAAVCANKAVPAGGNEPLEKYELDDLLIIPPQNSTLVPKTHQCNLFTNHKKAKRSTRILTATGASDLLSAVAPLHPPPADMSWRSDPV